jgi:hypothetical protein
LQVDSLYAETEIFAAWEGVNRQRMLRIDAYRSARYDSRMSTTEIERAIEQLPPEELARLRAWFAEFDAAQWDREFEQDVAAGRLDALADEALDDDRNGRTKEL